MKYVQRAVEVLSEFLTACKLNGAANVDSFPHRVMHNSDVEDLQFRTQGWETTVKTPRDIKINNVMINSEYELGLKINVKKKKEQKK